MSETPKFTFVEFNPHRKQRGAEAARVEVDYGNGVTDLLWMSRRDITQNLDLFGDSSELQKALAAYH